MAATHEQLTVCAAPVSVLIPLETQPPLMPDAPIVERFTTKGGYIFEKHTKPSGVVTWYRCEYVEVK